MMVFLYTTIDSALEPFVVQNLTGQYVVTNEMLSRSKRDQEKVAQVPTEAHGSPVFTGMLMKRNPSRAVKLSYYVTAYYLLPATYYFLLLRRLRLRLRLLLLLLLLLLRVSAGAELSGVAELHGVHGTARADLYLLTACDDY